jgi:glutamate formiminotransferase
VAAARHVGAESAGPLDVPVFLYEEAATNPERWRLD